MLLKNSFGLTLLFRQATREKLKETVNVQEAAVVVPDPSEYNMTVLDAKLMHEVSPVCRLM